MGTKEYYEARIETHRITQNGLLKLGILLLVGITTFGILYDESHDIVSLCITAVSVVLFFINLYWWVKTDKTIHDLNNELLNHMKKG